MTTIQMLYDVRRDVPCEIETFYHCAACIKEWKKNKDPVSGKPIRTVMSPADYARTQSGVTRTGAIQVWCTRHNVNIAVITPHVKEDA